MKNSVIITAGIVAAAATGVVLFLRNRKMAAQALEKAAAEVHDGKKHLRDYIRKTKHRMDPSLS